MDSKIVDREIAKTILPYLREKDFSINTRRNFWRYFDDRVEVINFQSFNQRTADIIGCTSFSFAINLGEFYFCIPTEQIKTKNEQLIPEEYACHLRRVLEKSSPQKQCSRQDIFYVEENGANLEEVINEALFCIKNEGFAWFERFSEWFEISFDLGSRSKRTCINSA